MISLWWSTDDATLVVPKGRTRTLEVSFTSLKVGTIPRCADARGLSPWGSYPVPPFGERFQVKQITVDPGRKLSLQKHYHRAEHWIVVNGRPGDSDGDQILLREMNRCFFHLAAFIGWKTLVSYPST
jgi:mannose-1-phosphate guanylyltransferase/mannose-1-phosphate guanylyltransferase/mannose-6-phosphate isomerase